MASLKIGDKVDGKVSRRVTRVGVVFKINGGREALMPREHYGKKLPRLQIGDEVAKLHILDVDPEAQGCAQIILSGENLYVPSRGVAGVRQVQQKPVPAVSTPVKEKRRVPAKPLQNALAWKTSPSISERVHGRVVKVINRVGIVFDIGAHCEAMMLHEDFGKKLPRLRPGDQVADLIVLDVDDEQEDEGRKILLSGEEVVKLTPDRKTRSLDTSPSVSPTPVLRLPVTRPEVKSPSPQEVEPPESDWSDSICELSVCGSDSVCELSVPEDAVLFTRSWKARHAGNMLAKQKVFNLNSSKGSPSTSSTGSAGIIDKSVRESRRKEECRIRRRARAVPFSRLPQETLSEHTHVAAVSSTHGRKGCGKANRICRDRGVIDSRSGGHVTDAALQGHPVTFMPLSRGRQKYHRVWQACRGGSLSRRRSRSGSLRRSRSASLRRSRSASPKKAMELTSDHLVDGTLSQLNVARHDRQLEAMNAGSKVADEHAIQALMSSILSTAQEMGVSCDRLSPVLSSLHHLNGNLHVSRYDEALGQADAGLRHRNGQPQTNRVGRQPLANAKDWSEQVSDNECCEGQCSSSSWDLVPPFPFDSRRMSQRHRLRRGRQTPSPDSKALEALAGLTRHHDRRSYAKLRMELARFHERFHERCMPQGLMQHSCSQECPSSQDDLSSEDDAWDAEAVGRRHVNRRAPSPTPLRNSRQDRQELGGMVRVLDDGTRRPPRRAFESLVIGEQVWGTVVSVLPNLGIWFDIGVEKDAMLPRRHFTQSTKMFEIGDSVHGLTIVCLDLVKNQITLSAEGLEFGESKSMSRSGRTR